MIEKMVEACILHVLELGTPATLREPYIPYIPKNWNGVLVLAEAQNHAGANVKYLKRLESLTAQQRYERLYLDGDRVGIQPWDDGTLKFAVEAAFRIAASETAVSNAILWSLRKSELANERPSRELGKASSLVWKDLLALLKPSHVIAAGAEARGVLEIALKDRPQPKRTHWALPSPRVLLPLSSMVNEADLFMRFPAVAKMAKRREEWLNTGSQRSKILYACLAVSTAGDA